MYKRQGSAAIYVVSCRSVASPIELSIGYHVLALYARGNSLRFLYKNKKPTPIGVVSASGPFTARCKSPGRRCQRWGHPRRKRRCCCTIPYCTSLLSLIDNFSIYALGGKCKPSIINFTQNSHINFGWSVTLLRQMADAIEYGVFAGGYAPPISAPKICGNKKSRSLYR